MRSLSPSTTFVCTRTLSPTAKFTGCLRNCSDSILSSNAWFINFNLQHWSVGALECWKARQQPAPDSVTPPLHRSITPSSQQIRPPLLRAQPRLLGPPARDFRVIAGQQHVRDLHSPELRRPRVLRIFEQP